MTRLLALVDEMTRKTSPVGTTVLGNGNVDNRVLHELYKLSRDACTEIDRLQGEVAKAWADGDIVAWREHAGRAMQSLIVMTGARLDDSKTRLVPAMDGMEPKKAMTMMAQLAEEFGDALVERDNKKRKEAGLT